MAESEILNNIEDAQQLIEDYLLFICPEPSKADYLDWSLKRLTRAYEAALHLSRQ